MTQSHTHKEDEAQSVSPEIEAIRDLLDTIHAGRFVPLANSEGLCKSVLDNAETALAALLASAAGGLPDSEKPEDWTEANEMAAGFALFALAHTPELSGLTFKDNQWRHLCKVFDRANEMLDSEVEALYSSTPAPGMADHGFDRTASHSTGEYQDTAQDDPGMAVGAEKGPLSRSEQEAVLKDLMGLECLINRHDCWEVEADAMDMSECGPHHQRRVSELLAIGRTIIAEDPDCWSDEQKAPFKLRYSEATTKAGGAS